MNRNTVPNGAWKSLEFTIAKAEEAMRKDRWVTLPGQKVLEDKGYGGLGHAISAYHGGFPTFRRLLGQESPRGHWKDINYAIQQARDYMRKEGWTTLPSAGVLNDKGCSSLRRAIVIYHGGFAAFRATLGQENLHGCWKDIRYTIQQAHEAMKKQGWTTLPGADALLDKGYGSLSTAIIKYHGGFLQFRNALGQESLHGRWKDLSYAKEQAQQAMQKEGWTTLPSGIVLREKGYGGLAAAIGVHHGGMPAFRTTLGQENRVGRWKNLDYTIQQAQQAMRKEGWTTLPSLPVLNDKGYSGLWNAIHKYHGGLPAFRELLAKAQGQPTHKEHLENLLRDYLDRPDQDDAAGCKVPA